MNGDRQQRELEPVHHQVAAGQAVIGWQPPCKAGYRVVLNRTAAWTGVLDENRG